MGIIKKTSRSPQCRPVDTRHDLDTLIIWIIFYTILHSYCSIIDLAQPTPIFVQHINFILVVFYSFFCLW